MGTSVDKRYKADAVPHVPVRTWSEMPLPLTIRMNLTHRCNFYCEMCTQYGSKFKNTHAVELASETWIGLLKAVHWARPTITIFGGEPTLYPNLAAILTAIADLGLKSEIVSNGYNLHSFLPDLAAADTTIFLSVDGTGDLHDKIRNAPKSFDAITRLLPQIKALGLRVAFNYVLTPDNVHAIDDFLAFCTPYHPQSITFQHLQFATKGLNRLNRMFWKKYLGTEAQIHLSPRKKYHLDQGYVRRLQREILRLTNMPEYPETIRVFPELDLAEIALYYSNADHFLIDGGRICSSPSAVATIDPNGDLSLCLDYVVGNIGVQDFWSLWDGRKSRDFRRKLERVGRAPICSRCCELYSNYSVA